MRASDNPGGSKAGIPPTGAAYLPPALPGLKLRVMPEIAHLIYAGVGDLRVIEKRNDLLRRELTRAARYHWIRPPLPNSSDFAIG